MVVDADLPDGVLHMDGDPCKGCRARSALLTPLEGQASKTLQCRALNEMRTGFIPEIAVTWTVPERRFGLRPSLVAQIP